MKYLITGATGAFGRIALETLLKNVPAEDVAVSVRDVEKAADIRNLGVDVRQGDFNDLDSMIAAFHGVDRVLMISTNEPVHDKRIAQHTNAIRAAEANNVKLLVYTSGTNNPEKPVPLAIAHIATEKVLRESTVPYCILRNNSYLETELATVKACLGGAPMVSSAGDGKIGFALKYDYAVAAVSALTGDDNEYKTYELSGKPITYDEFAQIIGNVIGKEIPVMHVDDEGYAAALKKLGMADVMIPMLVATKAGIRDGLMEVHSDDFEKLLGRAPMTVEEGLKKLLNS